MARSSVRPIRRRTRALLVCAWAALIVGCRGDLSAPGAAPAAGRVGTLPQLAVQLPAALEEIGASALVPFTRVRVLLVRADGTPALDSIVDFASGVDSLALNLKVRLSPSAPASGESLQLSLAYINAAGDTVFAGGPVTVLARSQAGNGNPAPVQIPVAYTGPGAQAVRVRLTPPVLTVTVGDLFSFAAHAYDAHDAEVVGAPVLYRSLDPARATLARFSSGVGIATASRGTVAIVASLLNGAADTAHLVIIPRAFQLLVVSGGGQSAQPGEPLPLPIVARVVDADGGGVPGTTVHFAAGTGGSATPADVSSDAGGYARTTWHLGNKTGAQSLTISSGDLLGSPFVIAATALDGKDGKPANDTTGKGGQGGSGGQGSGGHGGGPDLSKASMIVVSGNDQSAIAGSLLPSPLAVRVLDASGNALPGLVVQWKTGGSDGTASADTTITDAQGLSSNKWTLGAHVGAQSLRVSLSQAGGVAVDFTATALPVGSAPPGRLAFVTEPSDVAVGIPITPAVVVEALDARGAHDSTFTGRVSVDLSPASGGTRLQGNATVAAIAGLAVFDRLTFDAPATAVTLVASAAGIGSATSTPFAVTNPPTRMKQAGGDKQQAKPGSVLPIPLVVSVEDSRGKPLAGVTVTWRVTSGGGSIVSTSATDLLGLSSATWTLGLLTGTQTATASVDGLKGSPVSFSATAKP